MYYIVGRMLPVWKLYYHLQGFSVLIFLSNIFGIKQNGNRPFTFLTQGTLRVTIEKSYRQVAALLAPVFLED